MEEVKGLTTEELLADIDKMIPPKRLEGMGVTISDIRDKHGCGVKLAKEIMGNTDLVPVKMRHRGGSSSAVYMPKEQAEQYKEWVIE